MTPDFDKGLSGDAHSPTQGEHMVQPKIEVVAGNLVITLPVQAAVAQRQDSSSGKSLLLCSVQPKSGGILTTAEAGTIKIGLNVYTTNPAYNAASAKAEADLETAVSNVRQKLMLEQARKEFLKKHPELKEADLGFAPAGA